MFTGFYYMHFCSQFSEHGGGEWHEKRKPTVQKCKGRWRPLGFLTASWPITRVKLDSLENLPGCGSLSERVEELAEYAWEPAPGTLIPGLSVSAKLRPGYGSAGVLRNGSAV